MIIFSNRKHKKLIGIIALFITFYCYSLTYAQHEVAVEKSRNLIKSFIKMTGAPGIAVSVGIKGQIVWSEGFGYADLEQRVPVQPAITRFRIGSVSKSLTTVAVAQLYEQGKLDLDVPVQQYVPDFPLKKKGEITTRLLTGHLAGIRHYRGNEFLSQKHFSTVIEGLDIFKNDTLLHAPGSKYAYSSYGWNLISAIVENAANQDFLTFMANNVFKKIGMNYTIADYITPIIKNRTRYYAWRDGQLFNAPFVDNSYKWAGGGFLSTSEDLVRFGFAHLGSNLLKPETIKLLWTPQQTNDGKKTGYGIGWSVGKDSRKRNFVGHGGGSVGGSTIFRIYPENEMIIAVISNMSSVSYSKLPEKIADLFLGNDLPKEIAPSLLSIIKNNGIQEAKNYYSYLKKYQYQKYNFGEQQELDRLGKSLQQTNHNEEAIEIFKLNVAEFPDSILVYNSLGDAYDVNKQLEEAKKCYEKGLKQAEKLSHRSLQSLKRKLERIQRKMKRNR